MTLQYSFPRDSNTQKRHQRFENILIKDQWLPASNNTLTPKFPWAPLTTACAVCRATLPSAPTCKVGLLTACLASITGMIRFQQAITITVVGTTELFPVCAIVFIANLNVMFRFRNARSYRCEKYASYMHKQNIYCTYVAIAFFLLLTPQ